MPNARKARPWLLALLLAAAGCGPQVAVRLDQPVPAALVEPLPMTINVHYAPALAGHVYTEQSEARGDWRVDSGPSQIAMFRGVLGDLFDGVTEVPAGSAEAGALTLRPVLSRIQFATPAETGFDYFEAWVEYRIDILEGGEPAEPWHFSGYGQSPATRFGRTGEGVRAALAAAIRNAGATLATTLPEHPPIAAYLGR
ncbi:MAG: hypothetical protein ACU85V_02610 [Gammaproteobacteria bacterium]